MSRRLWATGALLALAAGLSACGKVGQLERPGPLFGHPSETAAPPDARDPNVPIRTVDPRERTTNPGPTSAPTDSQTEPDAPTPPSQ